MSAPIRTETSDGVRSIIFDRPEEYNTITPEMVAALSAAIDAADADPTVRVMLLRAEGPAFCAGYGLDWSVTLQSTESGASASSAAASANGEAAEEFVWDSAFDRRMLNTFVDVYLKLWYAAKPTISAVNGWCIAGGTDMVLCSDIIIAGEGARFGYPPARVWGVPTTAMWVYRLGFERAKRYLFTGDEIPAREAADIGMILECVPDDRLQDHAMGLARRMALLPGNQLEMMKLLCNQTAENMGFASSRTLGVFLDGVARHTKEGRDWVGRAMEIGIRQAVRERDDPFEDYGSRPR